MTPSRPLASQNCLEAGKGIQVHAEDRQNADHECLHRLAFPNAFARGVINDPVAFLRDFTAICLPCPSCAKPPSRPPRACCADATPIQNAMAQAASCTACAVIV